MDSVLEVLGIFLRLFIALGCCFAVGVLTSALAAYLGASSQTVWMLFGASSATLACALATWVWNG